MFLKKNYFLLISISIFIYQLVSCRVEDGSPSINKRASEDLEMSSDRVQSKNLNNYLNGGTKKFKVLKELKKNRRSYKLKKKSNKSKKSIKKLLPGISPLPD